MNDIKRLCVCVVWSVVVIGISWGGEAKGFERSVTCGPPPNPFACEVGEEAAFVNWPVRCVTLYANESASKAVDLVTLIDITQRALGVWNTPDCSDFNIAYAGVTSEDRVGYFQEERNANILLFRDTGWRHGRGVLALTSVTYDVNSGMIVDADIEFNSQQYNFTHTDSAALIDIDIENTMVHELGHFLGLDHSAEEESTMFASAPRGETKKRTLHADDTAGLCAIYPKQGSGQICPVIEPGVFEPGGAAGGDGGCMIAVGVRGEAWRGRGWGAALLGAFGLIIYGLKRRAGYKGRA